MVMVNNDRYTAHEVKQNILRNDFGTCQHIYDQEKKEIEQSICWPKPKINMTAICDFL